MKLPKDLREFVALLNASRAKYVIVGGYAVAFHGRPRFTGDIDLFIESSVDNGERIVGALIIFGFEELSISAQDLSRNDLVLQLGFPPNRIDLMTSIDGVTFDQAWTSREEAMLDGLAVNFISCELLIQNKLASGGPKDIAGAQELSLPE